MDGYQFAQAVREQESRTQAPRTPIIALTAIVLQDEARRCLDAGMDDYLSKPVALPELKAKINSWLARSGKLAVDGQPAGAPSQAPSQPAPDGPLLWDAQALSRLVGENPALHQRLIDKFFANAEQQVHSIVQEATAGNMEQAGLVAHTLKSAARTVGAMQLGALCEMIEKSRSSAPIEQFRQWCSMLDNALRSARQARGQG
jgi:DNA-binding response OmpR family regulator